MGKHLIHLESQDIHRNIASDVGRVSHVEELFFLQPRCGYRLSKNVSKGSLRNQQFGRDKCIHEAFHSRSDQKSISFVPSLLITFLIMALIGSVNCVPKEPKVSKFPSEGRDQLQNRSLNSSESNHRDKNFYYHYSVQEIASNHLQQHNNNIHNSGSGSDSNSNTHINTNTNSTNGNGNDSTGVMKNSRSNGVDNKSTFYQDEIDDQVEADDDDENEQSVMMSSYNKIKGRKEEEEKNKFLSPNEIEAIRRSIVEGLGLDRIPDPAKANVSQVEYERAHREYMKRLQLSQPHEAAKRRRLHTFHVKDYPGRTFGLDGKTPFHSLPFPLDMPEGDYIVEHSTLRLLLDGHDNREELDVFIYHYKSETNSWKLVSEEKLIRNEAHEKRWFEFDLTDTLQELSFVESDNINLKKFHLGIQFRINGIAVSRKFVSPVLNVFTSSSNNNYHRLAAESGGRRTKRSLNTDHLMSLHKGRRTECRGDNKKCCRHQMTVIFKDLKGFEFIIQPKTFDAGYCKGRCPPRYNPAHHHALLQSLIWKEDRRKAPRPCCAPSKLAELEILYFDENDSTKLKVSNWKNMRVLECACS